MAKWRCVCGYIYEGGDPPDFCPKCGATNERFERLSDDKV